MASSLDFISKLSSDGDWRRKLQQASWRGVPFQTLGGQIKVGRRNAVHEYPFRDTVWVEDLGRGARRIAVVGFLVGDDVFEQRVRLIAACEAPGDGELVHMTLGRMKVSLIDTDMQERWDRGRVVEVTFSFIEAGERVFPNNVTDTSDAVSRRCDAVDRAAAADFAKKVGPVLNQGPAVVGQAVSTTEKWSGIAKQSANDATNLINMVGSLRGSFGRYFGGRARETSGDSKASSQATGTSVEQLIAIGTVSRTKVAAAAKTLVDAAKGLSK